MELLTELNLPLLIAQYHHAEVEVAEEHIDVEHSNFVTFCEM